MATIFDSEFIDVSTSVLERITGVLPFNVSVRRGENAYTIVFLKDEELDLPRLKKYQDTKTITGNTFCMWNKSQIKCSAQTISLQASMIRFMSSKR